MRSPARSGSCPQGYSGLIMPDVRTTTRQNRLRAALRENLKRRKAQIRGRATPSGSDLDEAAESARQTEGGAAEPAKDEPERRA